MASKIEVLPEPFGPTIKLIGLGRLSKSVKSKFPFTPLSFTQHCFLFFDEEKNNEIIASL